MGGVGRFETVFWKKLSTTGSGQTEGPEKATPRTVSSVMIIVLVGLLLSGFIFAGFAWARKTVTLVVDGKETVIKTRVSTVGQLLQEKEIVPGPKDKVVPGQGEQLKDGVRVELYRAHHVIIAVDGEIVEFDTVAASVGEALKEKGITVEGEDRVEPGISEKVDRDVKIKVTRVRTAEETKTVSVPYSVKRETNPQMARGISRVIKKGKNGSEIQRWMVTYHDKQVVERRLVERKTVLEASDGVIQVGTGQTVSRGGVDLRFKRAMEAVITAYTYTGRNTASGMAPRYGLVAVDPREIPFGTRLYIEGYGHAVAADRGRDIMGNRIDVFLESEAQARRWGVRRAKVYILE